MSENKRKSQWDFTLFKKLIVGMMVLITPFNVCASAALIEFFVAPDGSDGNPGTKSKPFASLDGARDAVRSMIARGLDENVTIWLRGGTYALSETFVIGLEDSAPAGRSITYAAYGSEKPVITSGKRIAGWKKLKQAPEGLPEIARSKVWVADLPEAKGDAWRFRTLFDGKKMLRRARSEAFAPTDESATKFTRWNNLTTFHFPEGKMKNWSNMEDVEIWIRPNNKWLINYLGLASVDEENLLVTTSVPATYNMNRSGGPRNMWVENVIDALDEPGEWVLNTREGRLYYWPNNGAPSDNISAPRLRELIRVEGRNVYDLDGDVPVRGIHFRGLTLTCGDRDVWTNADKGIQHDWEMWDKDNALLRFRGAEDCSVTNCDIGDTGSGGVRIDRYGQNIRVEGNNIHDLGGTGVLLCGYGPGKKDVNKNNLISNNNIQSGGRLWLHNPGVFIWQSGENKVLNNRIHDFAYNALVLSGVRPRYHGITDPVKWTVEGAIPADLRENMGTIRRDECGSPKTAEEALRFSHARNNLIQDNELHDVMQILDDGNAIYLSCAGMGNVIRRNFVYNNPRASHGQLRFDDDQEHATIEKNIIFANGSGIALKHNNLILNNIIVDGTVVVKKETQPGSRVERNIFYRTDDKSPFYRDTAKLVQRANANFNLFHGGDETAGKKALSNLRKNEIEKDGKYADPMFADFKKFDFRLKPDSPALKMGIESIDAEKIGLLDDPAFPRVRKQGLDSTATFGELDIPYSHYGSGKAPIK
jgi:hypothetical protein